MSQVDKKSVVSISHNDLDGYMCSMLIEQYVKIVGIEDVAFYNVGYSGIYDKISKIIAKHQPEHLIITDLNVNDQMLKALLENVHLFFQLTILDHHRHDREEVKSAIDILEERGHRVVCKIVTDQSASTLTTDLLSDCQDKSAKHDIALRNFLSVFPNYEEIANIVRIWDTHDYTDMDKFKFAQIINDYFVNGVRQFSKRRVDENDLSVEADMRIYTRCIVLALEKLIQDIEKQTNESVFTKPIVFRKPIHHLEGMFVAYLTEALAEAIHFNYCPNKADVKLGYSKQLEQINAIRIAKPQTDNGDKKIEWIGDRVIVSKQPVSMSIASHWINTLDIADIAIIIFPGDRVELRKKNSIDEPQLFKIAKYYGGGGHPSAAGFPLKSEEDHKDVLTDEFKGMFR